MQQVEQILSEAISKRWFPGCAFAFGTKDSVISGSLGRLSYSPRSSECSNYTQWDLASLTKVVATTMACMRLFEARKLDLNLPVSAYLSEFSEGAQVLISVRNLLLHDSGLPAFIRFQDEVGLEPIHSLSQRIWQRLLAQSLTYAPGENTVYSDLGMVVLQKVVEKITKLPFERYCEDELFPALGLETTRFRPRNRLLCAPTEFVEPWRKQYHQLKHGNSFVNGDEFIQGEVHDPTAFLLGGVAGNAGIFSNVEDMAKLGQWLLTGPAAKSKAGISSATLQFFRTQKEEKSTRALGWDTKSAAGSSAGTRFSSQSFGHTGFTGTSLWVDPVHEVFGVLLTNRVHPTADNTSIQEVRPAFYDAVFAACRDV